MTVKTIVPLATACLLFSCTLMKKHTVGDELSWNIQALDERAKSHLDSSKWDTNLFEQDKEVYANYAENFREFPLNSTPFPVAEYDYAVSSAPFTVEDGGYIFKGIKIGEYKDPNGEEVIEKLTIWILTNDDTAEESSWASSRNYPYLTAQGFFKTKINQFDWVFMASPDGFSSLLINMKLFDLRFGETIVIFPQEDKSFLYEQFRESPNNYKEFKSYIKAVLSKIKLSQHLGSSMQVDAAQEVKVASTPADTPNKKVGSFADPRDGEQYAWVQIGNQVWMAENLRFNSQGSWLNPANPTDKYGRLYDAVAIQNACPIGWHLPTDQAWNELEMHLGMLAADAFVSDWRGTHGAEMKSQSGWQSSLSEHSNGTNSSGFNALPSGYCDPENGNPVYEGLGHSAGFWSAAENGISWQRWLGAPMAGVNRQPDYLATRFAVSCRCLKD
ncbi:MAG: FISUMP domain-containing protein [Saprospiraceae bacterium]